MGDISELKRVRLEKEQKLKDLGVNVHPERYEITPFSKRCKKIRRRSKKC